MKNIFIKFGIATIVAIVIVFVPLSAIEAQTVSKNWLDRIKDYLSRPSNSANNAPIVSLTTDKNSGASQKNIEVQSEEPFNLIVKAEKISRQGYDAVEIGSFKLSFNCVDNATVIARYSLTSLDVPENIDNQTGLIKTSACGQMAFYQNITQSSIIYIPLELYSDNRASELINFNIETFSDHNFGSVLGTSSVDIIVLNPSIPVKVPPYINITNPVSGNAFMPGDVVPVRYETNLNSDNFSGIKLELYKLNLTTGNYTHVKELSSGLKFDCALCWAQPVNVFGVGLIGAVTDWKIPLDTEPGFYAIKAIAENLNISSGSALNSVSEVSNFSKNFEIKSGGTQSVIKILRPTVGQIYPVGNALTVSWSGFNPNVSPQTGLDPNHVRQIDFWLWKGNSFLGPIGFLPNAPANGEFSWVVKNDGVLNLSWSEPWEGTLEPGNDYSIKIHRSGISEPLISTPNFSLGQQQQPVSNSDVFIRPASSSIGSGEKVNFSIQSNIVRALDGMGIPKDMNSMAVTLHCDTGVVVSYGDDSVWSFQGVANAFPSCGNTVRYKLSPSRPDKSFANLEIIFSNTSADNKAVILTIEPFADDNFNQPLETVSANVSIRGVETPESNTGPSSSNQMIKLTHPTAGQNISAGSEIAVRWSTENLRNGNIQLFLKLPNGVYRFLKSFTLTENQFSFQIPENAPAGKAGLFIGHAYNGEWTITDTVEFNIIRTSQTASVINALKNLFSK